MKKYLSLFITLLIFLVGCDNLGFDELKIEGLNTSTEDAPLVIETPAYTCESIQIIQPEATPVNLAPGETFRIQYKLIPDGSCDKVKFSLEQGEGTSIDVSEYGVVTGKSFSEIPCIVRVSSQSDPSIYADVTFMTFDAPEGIDLYNAPGGSSYRATEYIGAGHSQYMHIWIKNDVRVKPDTEITLVGTDHKDLSATLTYETYLGTALTVTVSPDAATSTYDQEVKHNVIVSAGGIEFALPFKISKLDPFETKVGDRIYANANTYQLHVSDGTYRGNGVYEEKPATYMMNMDRLPLGMIAYIGDEPLREDPLAASLNLPGLADGGFHGIAIPFDTDFVCRTENPIVASGSDFYDPCWSDIPERFVGDEMFSKKKKSLLDHNWPYLEGFDASRLQAGTSDSDKRLAYHNTVGLVHYNMTSKNSYRIHQALYVTSYEAHTRFGGNPNDNLFSVSQRYYYGSGRSTVNRTSSLGLYPRENYITPWCLPTAADLMSVFADIPTVKDVQPRIVKEKIKIFSRGLYLFSRVENTPFYSDKVYWTSQEADADNAVAFQVNSDGNVSILHEDKHNCHKCLPVFYF